MGDETTNTPDHDLCFIMRRFLRLWVVLGFLFYHVTEEWIVSLVTFVTPQVALDLHSAYPEVAEKGAIAELDEPQDKTEPQNEASLWL